MKFRHQVSALALVSGLTFFGAASAQEWSLEEAAKPYAGTTVDVVFLLRPGYEAAEAMLPEFEELTGIKINIIKQPYENTLGEQVRDFVADGDLDIALIDLVWIGNFAENDWIEPI
ncbi:MAG: sugar ABC transporter substrate-binding protein, partial [Alphaproteobacteria bacterium]